MSLEKNDILNAIRDAGNNISKAARKLGVARRTLQARMRFWSIPPGKAGRRKRKITYTKRARAYGTVAVVAAVVVGGVLLTRVKPTST